MQHAMAFPDIKYHFHVSTCKCKHVLFSQIIAFMTTNMHTWDYYGITSSRQL